jgi:cytochrome P450
VGILPELLKAPHEALGRIARQHPEEIVILPLGPVRAWFASHPPHVEHVLHSRWRNYTKDSPMWQPLRRVMGNGLATSEGPTWVESRRIIQPLFHHQFLVSLTERMIDTIARTLDALAPASQQGRAISMFQEMNVLTQNIILECVFDVAIDRREAEHMGTALATALREINLRMMLSFLPQGFPLPGERSLREALLTIDEGLMRLTRRWEQARHPGRVSLLALLREAANPETGRGLSAQQVRDELVTLWLAGNETTATAMSWVWALLEQHPEVEARVRAEVAEVLGKRRPGHEDLARLRYGRQVILEALRLYPPSWIIPRQSLVDDEIDGYFIPKGSLVLLSQYATQHLPSLWEQPEVFDPERFSPERSAGRRPYAFMAFGGGPRRCIGEHFSLIEAQLILAMMVQRYRPRLVPGERVEPQAATVLRPRGPLPMVLHPA